MLLQRTQVLFQHPYGGSQLQFQGIRCPLLTILGSYTDTVPIHTLKHTHIHIQFKDFLKRSLHAYTNQLLSHSKSLGNECQTGKGGQNSRQNAIICIKREIHIHIYLYMDRASLKTCGQHWMGTEYRIFCYNLHFVL